MREKREQLPIRCIYGVRCKQDAVHGDRGSACAGLAGSGIRGARGYLCVNLIFLPSEFSRGGEYTLQTTALEAFRVAGSDSVLDRRPRPGLGAKSESVSHGNPRLFVGHGLSRDLKP